MGTKRENQLVPENDPQFCRFWAAYPKRVAKKDARKAWQQIRPSVADVDRMVEALEWQSVLPQWTRDGGEYAPYPASYLRAERWTDEPPTVARKTPTYASWECPHLEPCQTRLHCQVATNCNKPRKSVAS